MMYLLLSVTVLFVVGILLRKFFPEMCAICFAVFTTWLVGLVGYLVFDTSSIGSIDSTTLGVLMGGSAVGGMYYLFKDKVESWQIFKLPYLITAFGLVYMVLSKNIEANIVILIISLWIVFFLIYFSRNKQGAKWFKEIVECCKNW